MKDILDPWRLASADDFNPDDSVYAVYSEDKEGIFAQLGEQMFGQAYRTEEAAKKHCFWIGRRDSAIVRIVPMPAKDYVRRHKDNLDGMNPFWELGRYEFLIKWAMKC